MRSVPTETPGRFFVVRDGDFLIFASQQGIMRKTPTAAMESGNPYGIRGTESEKERIPD